MWPFMSGWLLQANLWDIYSSFSWPSLLCICCGTYHWIKENSLQEMKRQNTKSVKAGCFASIFNKTLFAPVPWHSQLCWMWGFIMNTACWHLISVRKLHLFLSALYFCFWQAALPSVDKLIKLYLIWHKGKVWITKHSEFVEVNQIL